MKKININKNEASTILYNYLLTYIFTNKTKSFVKKEINKGNIKINNQKVNDNYILKENDTITIYTRFNDNSNKKYLECNLKINIFYEDENIIIIDKQKDVLCQEDKEEKVNTLNNAIKKYCYETKHWNGIDNFNEPALIHRIDRNTEGLILVGKNKEVIKTLNSEMINHHIEKKYLTIVHGDFFTKHATLNDFIKQNKDKNKMIVSKNEKLHSKPITTKVTKLFTDSKYSLLEVDIKSGKKHQIRAHLSFYGFPIVGDFKYSNNIKYKNKNKSQVLISNKITFNLENENLKYLNNHQFIKYELETKDDFINFLKRFTSKN